MDDELLSVSDASIKMSIPYDTLLTTLNRNEIPSVKRGKYRYIKLSIADLCNELKAEHGRFWRQHAPWKVSNETCTIESNAIN